MESEKIPTPELAKMAEVRDISQEIGEFIEWLPSQKMGIGQHVSVEGYREPQFVPAPTPIEELLARYFEIDLAAVERERRAILDALRGE